MNDLAARKRLAIDMFRFAYYHHDAFSLEQAHAAVLTAAVVLQLPLDDLGEEFRAWALEQPERGSVAADLDAWTRMGERDRRGG